MNEKIFNEALNYTESKVIEEYLRTRKRASARFRILLIAAASLLMLTVILSVSFNYSKAPSINEENNTSVSSIGGGEPICQVHAFGYHNINPEPFFGILGVSGEEFDEWAKSVFALSEDSSTDCPWCEEYNIRAMVKHFNIPREDFEEACRNMSVFIYNPEVIYSDDPSDADMFYRNKDAIIADSEKYEKFERLKTALVDSYGQTDSDKLIVTFGPNRISILSLVERFDVERSFFEDYFAVSTESDFNYEYDLDVIYDENGNIKEYSGLSEYEIDALFCGVVEFFPGYGDK